MTSEVFALKQMHCVLSYDITDPSRRRKLARLLEGYGLRIQYSLFEGFLSSGQIKKVVHESARFIKASEGDSLRIYCLCSACYPKAFSIGGLVPDWERAVIV